MANVYYSETCVWTVTETGTLNTGGVHVVRVTLFPSVATDSIEITDNEDNPAIRVKSMAITADPTSEDFANENNGKGRRLPSLKVGSISPNATAYIYLSSTIS